MTRHIRKQIYNLDILKGLGAATLYTNHVRPPYKLHDVKPTPHLTKTMAQTVVSRTQSDLDTTPHKAVEENQKFELKIY